MEKEKNLKNPGNLKPLFSFGAEGDEILSHPQYMATDRQASVFISDQITSRVMQYNLNGEFLGTFGSEGQGPGEFVYPSTLATKGERLYVQDGNMRLVSFNLDDKSSAVIGQNRMFIEFEIFQGQFYAFAPRSIREMVSGLDEDLIHVYDREGNMVNSFGEYLTIEQDFPAGLSWPHLKIEDGIVHAAFMYFPIYRAYSSEGVLIAEVDFSQVIPNKQNIDQEYRSNYDTEPDGDGSLNITAVSRAMDVYGSRIFICRQGSTIVIDEYLFNGNDLAYNTTYFFDDDLPENYHVKDFFYNEGSNTFYILEENEIPMVTVYQIIEDQ